MSRQAQLGLFAVIALVLLFGIFYVITDFGTRHSGYRIGVHFANAAGLPTGAQVFFSGVTVGTVDQVELMPDNTVDVILAIQNGINIPKDSRFMIQAPLTGTPNLVILPPVPHRLPPGYSATPSPPEAILAKQVLPIDQQPVGTPVASVSDLMQQGQSEVRRMDDMLALLETREPKLLATMDSALTNMDEITTEFKGTIADLSGTMDQTMREAGGNIVGMTSTLNSSLTRNQYKIDSLLSSLDATAIALNKSMDQMQSLASDPALKSNLIETTSNIRDLTANIAGMTSDLRQISGNPQTQAQLRDTVMHLDATMQKANSLLGTLGGRSHVYGVDAGATPYPVPSSPYSLPPPGTQTPPPNGSGSENLRKGLSHIASNLVELRTRFEYYDTQTVSGPNPLLTAQRGPLADINAVILPHNDLSAMVGVNGIGGPVTVNVLALKNARCLQAGGGVLYSQIGLLASCGNGKIGAEARLYNLVTPTLDLYGNVNVAQWAQVFFGQRDTTRPDRRTVYGLQLNFEVIPYRDERSPQGFAIAVWAIVAANAYFFYRELTSAYPAGVINEFALVPYDLTHRVQLAPPSPHPYWLTIVTSMFLHGGIAHIFFNMLFFVVFGPRIERLQGHVQFVCFYLLCGVAGGVAQSVAAPNSHIPEIGASGAIAGVMGAYLITFPASTIDTITPIGCFPLFLRLPAVVVIGIWAALQFFLGFGTFDPRANQGGVAYFAHIGGFSCGVIVQAVYGLTRRRNRDSRPRSR